MSDTSEITKGCLLHYDSRHIQVRFDFMQLCAYDPDEFTKEKGNKKQEPNQECMAKILRLIETLTDQAKTQWTLQALKAKEKGLAVPPEPKEYKIELTNGLIVTLLYETFAESTVRNSLDYLIDELNYLKHHQEKKNSNPLFWLNTERVQAALKKQAEENLSGYEIKPSFQGTKSNPQPVKSNPKGTKSNPQPMISNAGGFESTDINNSNTDNNIEDNEEESTDADASHAHALQEEVTHRLEHPVMQAISEEMVEQAEEELHATTPSRTDTRVSVGAGHRASSPSVDRHAAEAEVAGSQGSQTSRATPRAVRPGDAAREEGIADESHPTRDVSDGALVDATPVRRGVEAVAGAPAQSVDTSRPASRTTGAAGSAPPQSSGPRRSGRKAQAQDVTQALSLQGAQVKEWMESIKGRKRRMTPKNVEAWNALAEEEDISFENLRDVIAEWEKSQFAKEHPDYVFDEHVLTRDGGGFTFSKGMDIVRRKRRGKDPVAAGQTVSGYQYYQKPKSAKVEVD